METQLIKRRENRTMKKVFVSYHFTARDGSANGFGNYVGEFDEEEFANDLGLFILTLEDTISSKLNDKLGFEVAVKVLYFR